VLMMPGLSGTAAMPGSNPLVPVGIKGDAEHDCLAFFLLRRVRHEFKPRAVTLMVKHAAVALWEISTIRIANQHSQQMPLHT